MSKAWTDKQLKTIEKFKAAINEACEAFDEMQDFVGEFQALIEKKRQCQLGPISQFKAGVKNLTS